MVEERPPWSTREEARRALFPILEAGIRHTLLIHGADEAERRAWAWLAAGAALCEKGAGVGPCGECRACRLLAGRAHPDLIVLEPEGGLIRLGPVKGLERALSMPPLEGPVRVSLILEAGALGQEAANALLKTLEEPPEGNLIVLTAPSRRAVLPTIASRAVLVACVGEAPGEDPWERLGLRLGLGPEGAPALERAAESLEGLLRESERPLAAALSLSEEAASDEALFRALLSLLAALTRDLLLEAAEGGGGPHLLPGLVQVVKERGMVYDVHRLEGYLGWLMRVGELERRNVGRIYLAERAVLFWTRAGTSISYR